MLECESGARGQRDPLVCASALYVPIHVPPQVPVRLVSSQHTRSFHRLEQAEGVSRCVRALVRLLEHPATFLESFASS